MSASSRILSVVGTAMLWSVLAGSVTAQVSRAPDATTAYDEGVKAMEAKDYDAAIAAFTKATEVDNTYAEAFLGRAEALREQKDYSSAITAYNQARDINPKIALIYNGRGVCYRELGQTDLALNDFNTAMELDRTNPEIAANLGDLMVNNTQDPTNALRVLDKAVELNPEDAKVYRNRALAHAQLRHWDEAEKDLAKSIELKGDDFETHGMQAQIYLFQDKPEKLPAVVEALTHAIDNYPSREKQESTDPKIYVQGYLVRSDAYLKMANDSNKPQDKRDELYDKVIADAKKILEESPETYPLSGQALYKQGVALRMQGKYGEAIKAFTDAIQQLPVGESGGYATDAYLKRGICWHLQGENRLARGDFQQAASLDYTDPLPQLWTGYTFAEEGDYRSAIDSYGEAISKNPNFSLPYINRGLAYVQLGEYQRAAENFNEAIRVDPNNSDNFVKRGRAYMLMEEFEKAYNSFHLATLNDEKNIAAFEAAAEALRAMGKASTADEYEKRAADLKSQH
jgi:tetratricopeptide (TPR) repeat protein